MNTVQDVQDRVIQVVADQLMISKEQIQPGTKFVDDLGADSLDIVEMTMAVEDEFGMAIPDKEAEKMSTVQDVIDYVTANAKV